eukprot:352068-Chlamydomonas_euryale.AAC.3
MRVKATRLTWLLATALAVVVGRSVLSTAAATSASSVPRRALRTPLPGPPSLFAVLSNSAQQATDAQAHTRAVKQAADQRANETTAVVSFTAVNGDSSLDRVLRLDDDVLDSDAHEITIPLREDLDVVVVWDSYKASGQIAKLRSQTNVTQEQMENRGRLTFTGTLKGYQQGETMVTFVVAQDSFVSTIMLPEVQPSGDVITQSYTIKSRPGEVHTGVVRKASPVKLPLDEELALVALKRADADANLSMISEMVSSRPRLSKPQKAVPVGASVDAAVVSLHLRQHWCRGEGECSCIRACVLTLNAEGKQLALYNQIEASFLI